MSDLEGFTMRQKLNVPENLRAMARKKREYDPEGKRAKLLKWVRAHSGQTHTMSEIAEELGWAYPTVQKYTIKLEEEGRVSRVTRQAGWGMGRETRWFYHETPKTTDKQGNGPVTVREATPEERLARAIVDKEEVEPKTEPALKQPLTTDRAFVARVDAELWDFLRQADPRFVHGLTAFSNYLHQKHLGETITTNKE